jgi:hypothetical protein
MVMDENFLMKNDRAVELLSLMEKEKKTYSFVLFCSANIVKQLGIDFFVRMGISRIWIGVESKTNTHDKVKGIDLKELIEDLQSHGIAVLASTILFQDHHDSSVIIEEIDLVNSLNSDLVQFMNYTPWPTTGLYEKLENEGRLKYIPYRNQHGAGELSFDHPHFKNAVDHEKYLYNAFRKKYKKDGPAIMKMALTALRGSKLFKQTFGKPVIKDNLKSAVLLATACVEYLRIALSKISGKEGIIRQPSLHRVEYESRIIPDKSCIIKNNAVKTAVL